MAVHSFFCFPETSGKTLEDVEEMFLVGIPAWKTRVEYQNVRRAEQDGKLGEKEIRHESPQRTGDAATKV